MGGAVLLPCLHELLRLGAHLAVELEPVLLEALLPALGAGLGLLLLCLEEPDLLGPGRSQVVELVQEAGGVLAVLEQIALCACDDGFGQAVLPGHVQGLACAHLVVGEGEEGLAGLGGEEHGGRARLVAGEGVALEGRKVRGCEHVGALFDEFVEQGLGEGRALRRICARAELVEQHEAVVAEVPPGLGQVVDLGREGRDVVGQALLVADEGVDAAEPGQVGAGLGRHREGREGHGRAQAEALEADGLAAGVAARDDERLFAGPELDVQGMDLLECPLFPLLLPADVGIAAELLQFGDEQEGMADLHEADAVLRGVEGNAAAVEDGCQAALGLEVVELRKQAQGCPGAGELRLQQACQEFEHLVLALPLLALELLDAVVEIHEEHGLEVAGLARLGPVVDDALHLVLVAGLEGQDVAVRGERHELVLQELQDVVLLAEGPDPAQAGLVQGADLHAHLVELGRAFVADVPVVADAAQERGRELVRQGRVGREPHEPGPVPLSLGRADAVAHVARQKQDAAQRPERLEIPADGARAFLLHGVEQALDAGKGSRPPAGGLGAEAQGRRMAGPCLGLPVEGLGLPHGLLVGQGERCERALAARLRTAEGGEAVEDAVVFQRVEGALVDHGVPSACGALAGEAVPDGLGELPAVHAALAAGHEQAHDLPHLPGRGRARFGNGLLDGRRELFLAHGRGQVGFQDGEFLGLPGREVASARLFVLGDGVPALLAFLKNDVEHLLVGELAAGTAQLDEAVFDRRLEHAQHGDAHGLLGLVGCDVVGVDLFEERHAVSSRLSRAGIKKCGKPSLASRLRAVEQKEHGRTSSGSSF